MIPAPKPEPRKKQKKRISKFRENIENECVALWRDCVYIRAGFRSELSGQLATVVNGRIYGIEAHHRLKKGNHHLKFSLDNGICLTDWEHQELHFEKSPKKFMAEAEEMAGPELWQKLQTLKRDNTKLSLVEVRETLKAARDSYIEKFGNTQLLNIYLKQNKAEKS